MNDSHVKDCGCRTDADGRRIADMRCLDPAVANVIRALLAAQEHAAEGPAEARAPSRAP